MTLSLKLRQLLISIFLMLLLLPSSFIAIDRAFYTQLVTSTEQKLEVHMYAILSELNVSADKVELLNNALAPDFYREIAKERAVLREQARQRAFHAPLRDRRQQHSLSDRECRH